MSPFIWITWIHRDQLQREEQRGTMKELANPIAISIKNRIVKEDNELDSREQEERSKF